MTSTLYTKSSKMTLKQAITGVLACNSLLYSQRGATV